MAAVFDSEGRGRLLVIGGIDIRLACRLPGKPAESHAPHHPFEKLLGTIISWGQGQVCRKVRHVSRVLVKQALVQQEMYREQENSHLECPDHTVPNKTIFILCKISGSI